MGGKSAGSKGRKGRMLTQHPSSSQLPNGSRIHLPPLLPRNHRSCVGAAPGTIPAGWDVVEGGEGTPQADGAPVPTGQVFCFSRVASAGSRRDVAFPDVRRIRQAGFVP